jgi:MipA family protein
MKKLEQTLSSIAIALIAPVAMSQEIGPPLDAPMSKPFELSLGAIAGTRPAYLGSDDRKSFALPIVAARWSNGWFAGTTGIGYRSTLAPNLTVGARLSFDLGRKESYSSDLAGMGDIKARALLGTFASYRIGQGLALTSSLNYGSGNNKDGLTGDVGLRAQIPLGGAHRLMASTSLGFANSAFMQSQFGVTAAQATTTTYQAYMPNAGLRDLSINLGYGYMVSQNTTLQIMINARTLLGDAKDSPLTRSNTGVSSFIGLVYRM